MGLLHGQQAEWSRGEHGLKWRLLMCQVGAYANRFRFLQLEYDEVRERLAHLERLFKQHGCTTCDALLDLAAKAEEDLDRWFQMEGVAHQPIR
jgi:DNA repair ATPase RecN